MRVTEGVTQHEAVYKKKTAVGVTTLYWKQSEMQLPIYGRFLILF